MYTHAYQQYRQTQVETAGPGRLVLMLYDGGIRFLDQAQEAIAAKKLEEAHRALVRVQDIVSELMVSLNMEAGELARNLWSLYDYMYRRLLEANIKKDGEIVAEVKGMVQELRDVWQEALRQAGSRTQGGQGYGLRA